MPPISSKVLSVSRLHDILYPHGRHSRLQKVEDGWKRNNPLPPSEIPLYTMVSGILVEDGRENWLSFVEVNRQAQQKSFDRICSMIPTLGMECSHIGNTAVPAWEYLLCRWQI